MQSERVQQLKTSILRKMRILLFTKSTQLQDQLISIFLKLGYNGIYFVNNFTSALEELKKRSLYKTPHHLFMVDQENINSEQMKQVYEFIRSMPVYSQLPMACIREKTPLPFGENDALLVKYNIDITYEMLLQNLETFLEGNYSANYSEILSTPIKEGVMLILPEMFDDLAMQSIADAVKSAIGVIVLNFKDTKVITEGQIRTLFKIFKEATADKKNLFSINLASNIHFTMNSLGLAHVFRVKRSIEEVYKLLSIPFEEEKMVSTFTDPKVVNPFVGAIIKMLFEELSTHAHLDKPSFVATIHQENISLLLTIDITTPQFEGSVNISYSKPLYEYFDQMSKIKQLSSLEELMHKLGISIMKRAYPIIKEGAKLTFTKIQINTLTSAESLSHHLFASKFLSCPFTTEHGNGTIIIFQKEKKTQAI